MTMEEVYVINWDDNEYKVLCQCSHCKKVVLFESTIPFNYFNKLCPDCGDIDAI